MYTVIVSAQDKYATQTGMVSFEASVPSFEEVKAKHENASAILNTADGTFASLVLVRGFRFKVALMEEHFNENYMESSEYPKAVFKGKLQDFSMETLSGTPNEFMLLGTITIHGVTKDLNTPVMVSKEGNQVLLKTALQLNPEDFEIEIPSLVRKKIAESVQVECNYLLKAK